MPKDIMRSGVSGTAAAPAAAPAQTAAPAAASDNTAHLKAMEDRLRGMKLDEPLIAAALEAEKKKLAAGKPASPPAAAKPAATPAPAAPVTPKPAPKNVTPAKAAAPAEDPNAALAAAYAEDHGGAPPEENPPAPEDAGAAPDTGHEEEQGTDVVVQNHWSAASDGALSGPIDRSDFKIPQLKIVQGSGELSEKFNQGTLIFTDITIFSPPDPDKPGPPINIVPVTIRKYFRENVARDPNAPKGAQQRQPRNVNTADEVRRLGGTTEFTVDGAGNRIKPSWGPAAQCTVLIERPDGCDHPAFTIAINDGTKDRYWAAATMFVNGGQYRSFAIPIIDATNFILCTGSGADRKIVLEKRVWKMQVVKEKSGENMVFNPKLTMLPEATPEDLRALAASLRGSK